MKIVFMGTEDFGIPALEALMQRGHEVAAIVTTPPRPKGRGRKLTSSSVAEFAEKAALSPVFMPESLKEAGFLDSLRQLEADLFLVAAYRILPEEVFTLPRVATVNIHASLLPKYRGAAPIQRAIEAGETTTGVTIFSIDKGIDTGRIIVQKSLDIGRSDTSPMLYERLSRLGAQAIIEAVELMLSGIVRYIEQDEATATKAPKLSKEEGLINWNDTAEQIFNRIRAYKPFPGTFTMLDSRRLGIEWAEPHMHSSDYACGAVSGASGEWFEVQCLRSTLRVIEVKPEGKSAMSAAAFMRGTKLERGKILG
jgi:methionyl-tRNA formyltransferase